jgi:hypothetical protein
VPVKRSVSSEWSDTKRRPERSEIGVQCCAIGVESARVCQAAIAPPYNKSAEVVRSVR